MVLRLAPPSRLLIVARGAGVAADVLSGDRHASLSKRPVVNEVEEARSRACVCEIEHNARDRQRGHCYADPEPISSPFFRRRRFCVSIWSFLLRHSDWTLSLVNFAGARDVDHKIHDPKLEIETCLPLRLVKKCDGKLAGHLPRWARALRIGALEIWINPSNGWSSSRIRKIAPDTDTAASNSAAMAMELPRREQAPAKEDDRKP